jgi:hypothetical protein
MFPVPDPSHWAVRLGSAAAAWWNGAAMIKRWMRCHQKKDALCISDDDIMIVKFQKNVMSSEKRSPSEHPENAWTWVELSKKQFSIFSTFQTPEERHLTYSAIKAICGETQRIVRVEFIAL